jgi:hypothetical protein
MAVAGLNIKHGKLHGCAIRDTKIEELTLGILGKVNREGNPAGSLPPVDYPSAKRAPKRPHLETCPHCLKLSVYVCRIHHV